MKRLLVLTLVVTVVNTSAAFAGDSLLESANRVARATAQAMAVKETTADAVTRAEQRATVPSFAAALPGGFLGAPVLAQEAPGLEASGMGKGKKVLIAVAVAVVFAASAYAIDHKVEDNTPSSHGLREDGL